MSLQYIIDGYNLTNHPKFVKQVPKNSRVQAAEQLIGLIRINRASASPNNKFWIVFDGYPVSGIDNLEQGNIMVIFSRRESADDRIKKLVELIPHPKNVVVVSDDNEIKFFARSCGARLESVENFLSFQDKLLKKRAELPGTELTYTQMHKINEELKKLWLSS